MATIGVKIELEGAPKYTKNMKQLTAQTKLYQAQVKRLTAEMSTGVSAFTKSITTSKALQQQLQAQQNQSRLLAEQIKKTSEAQGEDSAQVLRLKTQYENLQKAIALTNQQLNEQGGFAGAVAAEFEEVGSKLSSVGEKMTGFGTAISKSVTGPLVAAGAASLKAFTEVDDAYDTLIKKTGATGEALESMQEIVNEIATEIPTSFGSAAEAVGEVQTRFGLTGDALKDLSKQFVEFAELNETDLSGSIDTVQKALEAFDLGADEAGNVLDRLNKVGQDTGISVGLVANGLVSNATAFKEMGLSIDEAATFMGQLEKSGANVESVMGGVSKALKNATAEGKPLDQALSDLQNTIQNGTGSMDGLSAAYDLFGKSGAQVYQAVKDGALDFEELSRGMESAAGSVSETFEATIDPTDELQQHMNELKLVGTDIANTMMPTIEKLMKKFGETVKAVSDAWNGLSTEQQDAIIKIAEVAAVVGPIIAVVGKIVGTISGLITGIGKIITFIPTISGAISAVGAVITGTVIPAIGAVVSAIIPFLPIIAGVAAAIAAVVIVVKNWGTITDWISEKWATFTEYISTAVSAIQEFFTTRLGAVGTLFAAKIEIIKAEVVGAVEIIKTVFTAFGETLKAIFTGDWEEIGLILENAWIKIGEIILQAKAKIIDVIEKMILAIGNKFLELKNKAATWGSDMIKGFIDGILAKWEALKETLANVANTVKDFLGFSEPSKGPMKNFNDWPKHMMQNYASGIESMRFLVKNAVADVSADVAILENPINADEMYDAVRRGASDAHMSLSIGGRDFSRTLKDMGVVFGG